MNTIRLMLVLLITFFTLAIAYGIGIKSIDLVLDAGQWLILSTIGFSFITFARL